MSTMFGLDRFTDTYNAVEVTERLAAAPPPGTGKLLHVRPYKENDGMDASIELLRALHVLDTGLLGIRNRSAAHAFEIWYRDGRITFLFVAGTDRAARRFRKQINAHYPNAAIREAGQPFPRLVAGEYVAGGWMELEKHTFFPIKHPEGVESCVVVPYRALTSEMVGREDSRMVVQVVFRPAKPSWTSGGLFGDDVVEVGEGMKQGEVKGQLRPRVVEASQKRRRAGETVQAQQGRQAFHTTVRILALSPDREDAEVRARGVGAIFEQYYNAVTEQGLSDVPVSGRRLVDLVERMVARTWTDREMVLTIPELAGVAHIPNASIETPAVDWNRTQSGSHLPPEAEQPQSQPHDQDQDHDR